MFVLIERMKNMKRKIVALLLAAALLLSLAGCKGNTDPTAPTQTSTEPPQTQPTDPPGPDMSHWETGKAALQEAANMQYVAEVTSTTTVDGVEFAEKSKYTVLWQGLKGEAPVASVQQDWKYCDQTAEVVYSYQDEYAYLELDGGKFRAESTPEDFVDLLYPALLIDETLYEDITVEVTDGKAVYTFAGATAGEEWMGLDEDDELEFQCTAEVEHNALSSMTCTYTGKRGAATIATTVTVKDIDLEPLTEVAAPEGEDWVEVEELVAPLVMKYGYMAMATFTPKTADTNNEIVIGAAALLVTSEIKINACGSGTDYMARNESDYQYMDLSTQETESVDYEELYRDGTLSCGYDGELESAGSLGPMIISGAYNAAITEYALSLEELDSLTMEYAAGCLVLEFTGNEESGISLEKYLSESYLGDPDTLDDLADAYETELLEGHLAVDMDTFLPTSYSLTYKGTHLFGKEYSQIALLHNTSLRLPSRNAYENITEETLPVEEPEEKAAPVLYKVTDDQGASLWLFGTIHVGDERTSFLPKELYDAFDGSDALAVEFDDEAFSEQIEEDPKLAEKIAQAYYYTDGTTAKDHLDEDVYEDAVLSMKAAGAYTAYTEMMRPSLWSNEISNFFLRQDYSLDSDNGMDKRLMERARQQEKKILNVESGLEQIQMMGGYSDDLQEFLLMSAIYSSRKHSNESTRELFEMWCRGDETELIEYLNDEDDEEAYEELTEEDKADMTEEEIELYEKCRTLYAQVKDEYEKAMMSDRNFKMLDVAKDYMESGDTVFYAVGLAHLLGKDGLVDLLRAEGYTVELVTYAG